MKLGTCVAILLPVAALVLPRLLRPRVTALERIEMSNMMTFSMQSFFEKK